MQCERSETEKVDIELVKKDVSNLIASGICLTSDPCKEIVIFEILALRSYAHLCEVFKVFREIAQCPVQAVVEKKFKGNVLVTLLAISMRHLFWFIVEVSDNYLFLF